MKKTILFCVFALAVAGSASATNNPKVKLCHKGQTLTVAAPAVQAHLKHGDKLGACSVTPPVNPPVNPPVTPPAGTVQENRVLACATTPVFRQADGSLGLAGDVTAEILAEGVFQGVKITIARFYFGVGATCDPLGGRFTGNFLDGYGYPIWIR